MKIKSIIYAAAITVNTCWLPALELTPSAPDNFCIRPDIPQTLKFNANGSGELKYSLTDWDGNTVGTGIVKNSNGEASIQVQLPSGYYIGRAGTQIFGLYVSPEYTGSADYFFGVDSAMSWLTPKPQIRKSLIELLPRHGIFTARERIWMNDIFPADKLTALGDSPKRQYKSIRDLYAANKIKLLEVSHDAPAWMKKTKNNPYPQNIAAYGQASTRLGTEFGTNWLGWEIWNEPDIGFGGKLPAEYYMPLVKSTSYYWKKQGLNIPLLGGVVTERCSENFWQTLIQSGLADLVDGVSIHHYSNWTSMGRMIRKYRDSFQNTTKPDMPIWVSECGSHYVDNGKFSNLSSSRNAAMQNVMKAIEAKAEGATGFYPFVYASYFENGRTFSMWSKNLTPMPELAGYFTVSRLLSGYDYLGTFHEMRVFGKTGVPKYIVIGIPGKNVLQDAEFIGLDGRKITASNAQKTLDKDGMIYMFADAVRLTPELVKCERKSNKQTISKTIPPSVILTPGSIDSANHHFVAKYGTTIETTAKNFSVTVNAVNLENKEQQISISPQIPWKSQEVPKQMITVPANGSASTVFCFNVPDSPDMTKTFYLKFNAQTATGKILSPLAMAINFSAQGLKTGLAGAKEIIEIPCNEIKGWNKNFSGKGTFDMSVTPQQTLRFEAQFEKVGHHWFYPTLKLKKTVPANAVMLFRAKADPTKSRVYIQLVDNKGKVYQSREVMPSDNNWHKIALQPKDFNGSYPRSIQGTKLQDFSTIRKIMIGQSILKDTKGAVEISDLLFYTK